MLPLRLSTFALLGVLALSACDGTPPSPPKTPLQTGVVLPIPSSEPTVRVRLMRETATSTPLAIGAQDQPLTIHGGDTTSVWDGPVHVTRTTKGWVVGGRGGPLPQAAIDADTLDIKPETEDGIGLPQSNGPNKRYPGSMRVLQDDDEHGPAWLLLNITPLEQYLPGVLQAELFAGWPLSTYQAQAVAARSYATMQVIQRAKRSWDVTDTASTQAYMGSATDQTARQGAQSTHGQVLSWNGGLVPGYFSSCCGGLPATGTEAVGPNPLNAVAPLSGHAAPIKCASAPVYSWKRDVDADALTKAFQLWGQDQSSGVLTSIGPIDEIQLAELNVHGRATQLRVIDISGNIATISAVDAGAALFDIDGGPPMSGWFSATRDGDTLKLVGRGFGHGAGLCQYGAAAMGESGELVGDILKFYYPGATVKAAW